MLIIFSVVEIRQNEQLKFDHVLAQANISRILGGKSKLIDRFRRTRFSPFSVLHHIHPAMEWIHLFLVIYSVHKQLSQH